MKLKTNKQTKSKQLRNAFYALFVQTEVAEMQHFPFYLYVIWHECFPQDINLTYFLVALNKNQHS